MENTPVETNVTYKEFEIPITVTEQIDGTWRADVWVYLGSEEIGNFKIPEAFATKILAENAASEAGKKCAEKWRRKIEQEEDPDGAVILVWGVLYRFQTPSEAAAVLKWLGDSNATHEDFEFKYGRFQIPVSHSGLGPVR